MIEVFPLMFHQLNLSQFLPKGLLQSLSFYHAPKLHTDNCRINWSDTVENIHNLIRGLSPYPAAFTVINEKMFKIFRSKIEIVFPKGTDGDNETDGKTFLKFACADGYILLKDVQLEGKKRLLIEDFLRGYRFA